MSHESRAARLDTHRVRIGSADGILLNLSSSGCLVRLPRLMQVAADATLSLYADDRWLDVPCRVVRCTETEVQMAGERAQCHLDGAFVVDRTAEANIVTNVDHQVPHGETRELIKGVAAGRAHGAFQGKITVREHAQKVDAHQMSRNLILGGRAVIDTKPELEIYADDVKCAHGASVGELDETALFYLRTRGIPEAEARHMLIEGFLREPVEEIADPVVREYLLRRLARRLERLEE